MKIKLPLIGAIVCFFIVFSFANSDPMSYYRVYQDSLEQSLPSFGQNVCGCSHKEELNGEVIGFYPYWYAGDTTKWVDFEGITRLAYFGLRALNDGSLAMPSGVSAFAHLDKEENYEFVNDAHRHNVQVDWVVTKDDWDSLKTERERKTFFDTLSKNIYNLLNFKVNSYFQRFVNTFTFYTDEFENRGDGVTLYFKNFPIDSDATQAFNIFFDSLKTNLEKKNAYVHVNLMVNRVDLSVNKGIYSYENFLDRNKSSEDSKKISRKQIRETVKNYLFVVMDEPVSRNKQVLLNDLDLQLEGMARRNMLHALVPFAWLDSVEWKQFAVDALYYNDTYYNIGLAPYVTPLSALALDTCDESGNLGKCMLKYFENEEGDGLRQGSFSSFVCRYRWMFRFMNIFTFFVAIGVLIAYFSLYRVADFFNSRLALLLGIVVAPSAIMMTLISRFDPFVAEYRGTFGLIPILVLLVTVIAIILIQVYRKNDLPKRRGR